ncbi:MAG TPA: efflux RND transporter periplasmic adaptor subunit [Gemmataceae bacterium]|jgi:HlyD family secretion protein|nr:efflux RND transporter periplasmic adaptor subunit [Gemmataceae bacterium]
MKFPIKLTIIILIVVLAGAAVIIPARSQLQKMSQPRFRQAEVSRGPIIAVVNSTGTINPVLSISIGSFVSGPIIKLPVEFNQKVKKDDLLAEIDPKLFQASVDRDEANVTSAVAQWNAAKAALVTREADAERAKALKEQAENDENRAISVRKENKSFVSDTEMDQFKFNCKSLKAQYDFAVASVAQAKAAIDQAEANVKSAKANLKFSIANLDYTKITAPEDGIIIDRKIDPGQTLAAQFQTPVLFIIGKDMEKRMYITATVDESDIGMIKKAQERNLPVHFTVGAYPDDLFQGKIFQVRMNSTSTQNVVTYPVVVESPNPELKLLPGMTANLSFQVSEATETLRIPNAALRFYPQVGQVRPEDRKLLEGAQPEPKENQDDASVKRSAIEAAETRQKRNKRHVWVVEGRLLKAVEVVTGISDHKYTQLLSGDLTEGQKLVTGGQP